jgi:excisionase family DNA binding protein
MTTTQILPIALKISEACSASRCGRTTLYAAITQGELRAVKRGKSTLILESDLRRWLESLPAVKPKPCRIITAPDGIRWLQSFPPANSATEA